MPKILVAGLINYETTLRVDRFPIGYEPVRYPFFGVRSTVSGVGYNLAKALTTLGDEVKFLSMIGDDGPGQLALAELQTLGIPTDYIRKQLKETPQSVIIYDDDARRQINVDLKDIQEQGYAVASFEGVAEGCDIQILCNINFTRPLLSRAKQMSIPIATDVHTISDLEDDYNRDYMAHADILFMSHESLPDSPEVWMRRLLNRYGVRIAAVSLGAAGVLLAVSEDNFMERIPAVKVRPIVNTIGAGDALFSSFLHFYVKDGDPYAAIQKAVVFAAYKIGEAGAAQGFLDEDTLNKLYAKRGK